MKTKHFYKKLLSAAVAAVMIVSSASFTAFAADDTANEVIFEAEELYTAGKTTTFNRTVTNDTGASGSAWLCRDGAAVGEVMTLTVTVPDGMYAARLSTRYKGRTSGRASLQAAVNGKNYGSAFSTITSTDNTYASTAYGYIFTLTPGEEVTVSYTVTVSGIVGIDYISFLPVSTVPTLDGEVIINEDFANCTDNFGFASYASVPDGRLKIADGMTDNYSHSDKAFSADIASADKVDVAFEWSSNLKRGSGSKAGLEFRDDSGNVVFAVCGGGGGTQLRYATETKTPLTGTSYQSSEADLPGYKTQGADITVTGENYSTQNKTFLVHFNADFVLKTVSFSIADKDTGFIVAQKLDQPITAANLSKMIAGNYYTYYSASDVDDPSQYVDNFTLIAAHSESAALTVNYVDSEKNPVTYSVYTVYEGKTVTLADSEPFYLSGMILKSAAKETYTYNSADAVNGAIDKEVTVEVVQKYAATNDGFTHGNDADAQYDGKQIFIAAVNGSAPSQDADGVATYSGGSIFGFARTGFMKFSIDSAMRDKAVLLNVYVTDFQSNKNGACTVRAAAYSIADIDSLAETGNPIFSVETVSVNDDGAMHAYDNIITFDVSEAVAKALSENADTIAFKIVTPIGGFRLADSDAAGIGGLYQGKAAYLSAEDASALTVTGAEKVTKNGSLIEGSAIVPAGGSVKITPAKGSVPEDDIVCFTDAENKIYLPEEGILTFAPAKNTELVGKAPGISIVQGAQIRYGAGVDQDGKITGGNGIRFIANVDRSDTLAAMDTPDKTYADENVEIGVRIAPADLFDEDGVLPAGADCVYIAAEKYQTEDNSVFTAALTNLIEHNYNRTFRACAYVKLTDAYGNEHILTTDATDRSIYQVAAGLLKMGTTSDGSAISGTLYDVLLAYINQVGIRLDYTAADGFKARTEGNGAYTGDVFFTVTFEQIADGSYKITVAPDDANFNTTPEIKSWWKNYVRINNNHSTVALNIPDDQIIFEGNTLTFTFNIPTKSAE